jgi:hypothetical protein
MATLQLEQAALLVNRPPDAIERWILDGKVDAERSGGEWLVDSRSLLNAAVSEDVAVNGNGHAHVDAAVAVTIEPAPAPPATAATPPAAATDPSAARAAADPSSPAAVASADAPNAPPATAGAPSSTSLQIHPGGAGHEAAVQAADMARQGTEPPVQQQQRPDSAIADVATVAIQALNARLEQAIGEVERLQDERLKLALQLGYAQSQLRQAQDQLKMLAPPESDLNPLQRFWRKVTGR